MKEILVVTGSVRPNSVNSKIVPVVVELLEQKDKKVTVADVATLNLPFFDSPIPPNNPNFSVDDENVVNWTKMVDEADAVVLVTPEYNHTMSPIQLNAIDWIGKEWEGKPVALVGYGWTSGGAQAHDTAREALAVTLSANVSDTQANLFFGKDITPDGDLVDEAEAKKKIEAAIDSL